MKRFVLTMIMVVLCGAGAFAKGYDVYGTLTASHETIYGNSTVEGGTYTNDNVQNRIIFTDSSKKLTSTLITADATGNLKTSGVITADAFYGSGSGITGISADYATLSGTSTNSGYAILSGTSSACSGNSSTATYAILSGTSSVCSGNANTSYYSTLSGTSSIASSVIDKNVVQSSESGALYNNLKNWFDTQQSSGRVKGYGSILDLGDGSVWLPTIEGIIKIANSDVATNEWFHLEGRVFGSSEMTNQAVNWGYVTYNSGSPTVAATTDRSTIRNTDQFILGRVWKDGNDIESVFAGDMSNFYNKEKNRLIELRGIERVSGGNIVEYGNRGLNCDVGAWYFGLNRYTTSAHTGVYTFEAFYRDGGTGWKTTSEVAVDNIHYDDGSGTLATLTANRYAVYWIYVCDEGDIYALFGQGDYTLTNANNAMVPTTIPPYLNSFAKLAGKVIVQKSATNFTSLISAYTTPFPVATPSDHNDLSGLQGGEVAQYYHFNAANHGKLGYVSTSDSIGYSTLSGTATVASTVADGAIVEADFGSKVITAGAIADGTITTTQISNGTIINLDIATLAQIDGTKVNAGTNTTRGTVSLETDSTDTNAYHVVTCNDTRLLAGGATTGEVLQVVILTSTATTTSNAETWTEILTSWRQSFTPKSATSKLYLNASFGINTGAEIWRFEFYDITNSAEVGIGPTVGVRVPATTTYRGPSMDTNDCSMIYMTGTTNATNTTARTYTIRGIKETYGTNVAYINHSSSVAGDFYWTTPFNFSIQEISQ